jgi:hypothetical protein
MVVVQAQGLQCPERAQARPNRLNLIVLRHEDHQRNIPGRDGRVGKVVSRFQPAYTPLQTIQGRQAIVEDAQLTQLDERFEVLESLNRIGRQIQSPQVDKLGPTAA